jgi:hypothetical protein
MKTYGLGFAIACMVLTRFEPPTLAAQENPPGRLIVSDLSATLHLLEPVPITHKGHAENKEGAKKVQVGDKVLIRVSYDPAVTPVKDVEVHFSNKGMSACEAVKVPREPSKDKKDTAETFGVVVRARDATAKTSLVGVTAVLADGTKKTLYFKFDIQPK